MVLAHAVDIKKRRNSWKHVPCSSARPSYLRECTIGYYEVMGLLRK